METYNNSIQNYIIRTKTFQGRKHLVVPTVMMVEGVHNGSHGPLLHLAQDLGMFPAAWNGIPVTVSHPSTNDGNISANDSPEVSERVTVGRVFNTHMVGTKLKAEVYIDEAKIKQISPEALAYIRQGRPLDVSVGVFTEEEQTAGEYNGETYTAIARHHRPDHLALLPGEQGACSWADGCGIRANSENSLLNKKDNDEKMNEQEILALKDSAVKRLLDQSITDNAQGYSELLNKVRSLVDSNDSATEVNYLEEVYDGYFIYKKRKRDDQGRTSDESYYQQHYNSADGGLTLVGEPTKVTKTVSFNPINTNKEPLRRTKPAKQMENNQKTTCFLGKVEKLTANKQFGFTPEDKEWLLTQEESLLDKLLARPVAAEAPVQANASAEQVLQVFKNSAKTPEEFISLAPAEMQESMRNGLALHKANKANLVKKIMDNSASGTWDEAELTAMPIETLEKMGKMIKTPVDYSAQAHSAELEVNASGEEPLYPTGVSVESKK